MSKESIEAIYQHACEGAAESIGSTRSDWQQVVDAIRELRDNYSLMTDERDLMVKSLAYVIRDLEIRAGTSGVVELGHGCYLQAKRALEIYDGLTPSMASKVGKDELCVSDLALAHELRSAAVEYFNATIAETVRHEVKIVSTNRESFDRIEAAAKRLQEILDRTSKSKEVPHDRPV